MTIQSDQEVGYIWHKTLDTRLRHPILSFFLVSVILSEAKIRHQHFKFTVIHPVEEDSQ